MFLDVRITPTFLDSSVIWSVFAWIWNCKRFDGLPFYLFLCSGHSSNEGENQLNGFKYIKNDVKYIVYLSCPRFCSTLKVIVMFLEWFLILFYLCFSRVHLCLLLYPLNPCLRQVPMDLARFINFSTPLGWVKAERGDFQSLFYATYLHSYGQWWRWFLSN